MSRKKTAKDHRDRVVYSTDPGFRPEMEESGGTDTLLPGMQKLRVRLDTRYRAGKCVTMVEGFTGTTADLEDLGKKMKAFCGTGGTVKEGCVIIQGDHLEKLAAWLAKNGYTSVKRG